MPRIRPITNWDQVPVVFDLPMLSVLLGQSREMLRIRASRGEIPAKKVGREWRFEKEKILKWLGGDPDAE